MADQTTPMLSIRAPLSRIVVDASKSQEHCNVLFTANEARQLSLYVRKFLVANRAYFRDEKARLARLTNGKVDNK
jgi:hypothetical protein